MTKKELGFIVTLFILLSACKKTERDVTAWYLDTSQLWKDYYAAVEDTRIVTPDEICHSLPTITIPGDNPGINWTTENGENRLLVGSLMSFEDAKAWPIGADITMTDGILTWVTLPYDLEAHIRTLPLCRDSSECNMRIIQLLGLPPDCNCDRLVFFYVSPSGLLRPTPDPEISDCEASLSFPTDVPEHYRKWFEENSIFSYQSDTPYPWTRLGYTYNWNREITSKIGPGEFIVHPKTKVRVERVVTIWSWYKATIPDNRLTSFIITTQKF